MPIQVINFLILLGAVQGLILTLILFFQTRRQPAAKFLGGFMLVLSYNGFETFNWSADINFILLQIFPYVLIFGLGPCLYLYVSSILKSEQTYSSKILWLHFSPIVIQFLLRTSLIIYHVLWINQIIPFTISPSLLDAWHSSISEPLSVLVFLVYLGLTVKKFNNLKRSEVNPPYQGEERNVIFKWVKALILVMIPFGIIWVVTILTPFFLDVTDDSHYYLIEILLVIFIYWVAFGGYHHTKIIYVKAHKTLSTTLPEDEAAQYLQRLRDSMETDKLYLNPDLNLNSLAAQVGLSPKSISTALNQHLKKSFNDFINEYRVAEVKQRLLNPAFQHFTISGIAFESGFNSQATFQRAFKKATGLSPKEYAALQMKKTG